MNTINAPQRVAVMKATIALAIIVIVVLAPALPIVRGQDLILKDARGLKVKYIVKHYINDTIYTAAYMFVINDVFALGADKKYNISIHYKSIKQDYSEEGLIVHYWDIGNYIPVVWRKDSAYTVYQPIPIPGPGEKILGQQMFYRAPALSVKNPRIVPSYIPFEYSSYSCEALIGETSFSGLNGTIVIDLNLGILLSLNVTDSNEQIIIKAESIEGATSHGQGTTLVPQITPILPLAIILAIVILAIYIIINRIKKLYYEIIEEQGE